MGANRHARPSFDRILRQALVSASIHVDPATNLLDLAASPVRNKAAVPLQVAPCSWRPVILELFLRTILNNEAPGKKKPGNCPRPARARRRCQRGEELAGGSAPKVAERIGGREVRAGPGVDRRYNRSARNNKLRQRQVLRNIEILERRAARTGPSNHQFRIPSERVHQEPVDDYSQCQSLEG